jgi:hypothetical protein
MDAFLIPHMVKCAGARRLVLHDAMSCVFFCIY